TPSATNMPVPKTSSARPAKLSHPLAIPRSTSASPTTSSADVRPLPFFSLFPPTNHPSPSPTDASGIPSRSIELDIDIGADARDWDAIKVQEKLKPVEADLRRIEAMVGEIVTEMDYMRLREQKLRDTNESTNERVKWFAFGTMGMLLGLGAWQVVYLRAYFR
ncbi:vesicle coat component, partial [Ophidiomyces ophidiicola]